MQDSAPSKSLLNASGYPVLKAEWLLNRPCQLACEYCEVRASSATSMANPIKEVSFEEKKKIADKCKEFGVFPVIYGGETTLSKDFENLLKYLQEIDLDYAVISNGLVDLFKLERWCSESGLKNWSVSIDTLNFDPNRTDIDPETVRKARAGYATIQFTQAWVSDRVTCTTITKSNIQEIPSIVKEMSRLKVWTIFSLVNQGKPGFRYSANAPHLMPSQAEIENLVRELKAMRAKVDEDGNPLYMFHDPEAVWDMWVEHGVKADWHCSRFVKFTIDADGTLGCCVDWKGKNFSKVKMVDVTRENFSEIEKVFLEDIWDCKGCAWAPIKLLETEQAKGDIAHDMLRHKLGNKDMQHLLTT